MGLWRAGFKPGGAVLLADVDPGPPGSFPGSFAVSGRNLFFTAHDAASGTELWAVPSVLENVATPAVSALTKNPRLAAQISGRNRPTPRALIAGRGERPVWSQDPVRLKFLLRRR